MGQIIVSHTDQDFVALLELHLSEVDIDVVAQEDIENAISLLEILPMVNLTVIDHDREKLSLLRDYKHRSADHSDMIIIIVGNSSPTLEDDEFFYRPQEWQLIISQIKSYLNIDFDSIAKTKDILHFIPIAMKYLFKLDKTEYSLFCHPDNLEEIFSPGEEISYAKVQRLIQEGTTEFYISKEHHQDLFKQISAALLSALNDNFMEHGTEQKIAILGDSFDFLLEEIRQIGFKTSTLHLTKTIVEKMTETAKDNPESKQWIMKILNAPNSIQYQVAFMISIVSQALLKVLKPNEDLSKQHSALTYAAFAHDLPLLPYGDACLITSEEELQKSSFDEVTKNIIRTHAQIAIQSLEDNQLFPNTVKKIILQHHGTLQGDKLAQTIDEGVSLLSKIFIITETFVTYLLRYKISPEQNTTSVFPLLQERFTCHEGELIIKALKKVYSK